jgi:His-Xaa-Ser system radical SAM maturase HxsC
MTALHARIAPWEGETRVLRITRNSGRAENLKRQEALLDGEPAADARGFGARLTSAPAGVKGTILLPAMLRYLGEGDIVRLVPSVGEISVLYRRLSSHNTLMLTENCNSNCVMCSQPPKTADDSFLAQVWLEAIPLMDPATAELGLSGGEPTLLKDRFLDLLRACRDHLPSTAIHVLSNGRLFNYLSLAQAVADVGNADLMIGVPLYSDLPARHDFVVQAAKAFDQTIRGMINLKRCGVRIELRVVLHRETVDRLPQLATFIVRNLPFVDQVSLMGLELMGFARGNLEALWVDPVSYQKELQSAVMELSRAQLNVAIYNHQLCVLNRGLWPFAVKSISDWKNEYLEVCSACSVRDQCGGFFESSARLRYSKHIDPVPPLTLPLSPAT